MTKLKIKRLKWKKLKVRESVLYFCLLFIGVLSLFLFILFDLWRLRLYDSNWGVQPETRPKTRKIDPITDPFRLGSDFNQLNPINIGSGFESQINPTQPDRNSLLDFIITFLF